MEPVKNLVVIVARRRSRFIGELHGVGAFEDEDWRVFGRELGMNARVVESIVLVSQDFYGRSPRASGRVGLGIPEFAENGGLAEGLHENGDPPFAPGIPCDGTAVRF